MIKILVGALASTVLILSILCMAWLLSAVTGFTIFQVLLSLFACLSIGFFCHLVGCFILDL